MKLLKEFSIQFAGLTQGHHQFEFQVNDSFFNNFKETEITDARINVKIDLEKCERILMFSFWLKGVVSLTCDRCLDKFNYGIESQNKLIVKTGLSNMEETDEIISITEKEHEFNIAQFIYEYAHLALPVKRIHPDDENGNAKCNKEILEKLNKLKHTESIAGQDDPRWNILEKLNFN